MRKALIHLISGACCVTGLLASSPANAGIAACGDVELAATAQCQVIISGCSAQCTPPNFKVACAAQGYAGCQGQCSVNAQVSCTADCEDTCTAQCQANPGSFDCSADCHGTCDADCDSQCAADSDPNQCGVTCGATCDGECTDNCSGALPSASCTTKCDASCTGSCSADANLNCQLDCQAGLEVDCETNMQGGCDAQCADPSGALFCDGQYINVGSSLQDCVNAIESELNITVQESASCTNGTCSANASVSCSVQRVGMSSSKGAWGIVVGMLGLAAVLVGRRRRA